MKNGLHLAGRDFRFLAYSMSSLKFYTVWFVAPFEHDGSLVTAKTIRDSLGDFR
jgi:RNA-dependent RNA polymerase